MMTLPRSKQEAFLDILTQFRLETGGQDTLEKARSKAWERFLEMGLPTRKTEVYGYVKLHLLFSQVLALAEETEVSSTQIAPHFLPEAAESTLVFINGYYSPSLSHLEGLPKKVVCLPLEEAATTYGAFLNTQWSRIAKEESDPFALLNAALHPKGVFLYLPPNTIVENPIHILNITDATSQAPLTLPRLHMYVGKHSEASLISSQAHLSGESGLINQVIELVVEENAHVQMTQVACDLPEQLWYFDALRVQLKKNSSFKCVSVTDGAKTIRNDYRVSLTGENSEASLNGVWMLQNKREAHTNVLVDHRAPNCRSTQAYKGVLKDASRSSFEGKIFVHEIAQKTDAFQLNNNLLLSERANADSKPNLEIFADDVKASHGATVGQVDKEQLLYMRTRGLSEEKARNLLVAGYCQEVTDLISIPSLLERVKEHLHSYLGQEG